MKTICFFLLFLPAINGRAQFNEEQSKLKVGTGYTQDFPGLAGYSINGYPRTKEVKEYTRATTLDFSIYLLPLNLEQHIIRVGGSYTFSFYKTRRAYPLVNAPPADGSAPSITWMVKDKKGTLSGFNLVGEYEYLLPSSNLSLGIRGSLFKAYDRVSYIGAFAGFQF